MSQTRGSPKIRRWWADVGLTRPSLSDLALPAVAGLAAVLYLVNLTMSGYANTYYALAAQAGSQSWSAMFFGSLDASNFVTLDKPPLATWLMGLSVRFFGLGSWSVLVPQALLGVATVVMLFLAVRRSFGLPAAFIAGLVMALTPVAVLIFRYDNPDAVLTFLLVAGAWALGRGIERGRLRWALAAATLVGAAFLAKSLQAYLVLPAFALTWLVSAPGSIRRRLGGLAASLVLVLVASGWWVAIVELIPASARPYIGGSQTNSELELIFGYNGLGRLLGNEGSAAGIGPLSDDLGPGAASFTFGGTPGPLRLFNDQFVGEIGWLLPAALLSIAIAAAIHRQTARTDRRVAGYVLWGSWLLVHVAVLSLMSGIVHAYYAVALAPAIAALVGGMAAELWDRRKRLLGARLGLVGALLLTTAAAVMVLGRTPAFVPGLRMGVMALAVAASVVFLVPRMAVHTRLARASAALSLVAVLAGPTAYSVATIALAHGGGDPAAGPNGDGIGGGTGDPPADSALITYLLENQIGPRWIVAIPGSRGAASIQLPTGQPVMAMGGFDGSDPTPTVDQLEAYVAADELRYVVTAWQMPADPNADYVVSVPASPLISSWVTLTCRQVPLPTTSSSLYDCSGAAR